MRRIDGFSLWIGTARDARDIQQVLGEGIEAIVDLALEELPITLGRELAYLRFPLRDGAGNPNWLLKSATANVVDLLRQNIPTLVACGAGMSRSPAVAAMAIAICETKEPLDVLASLKSGGPLDVSPGLWQELMDARPTEMELPF